MARAKIPYDYFRDYLEIQFPRPAYDSRFLVSDYARLGSKTPVRVYDRSSGNFKAVGWFVEVQYSIFTGFRENSVVAEYENKREMLFIPDEQ